MGISWRRVIVGGLAAGLVINVSGLILRGLVLKDALTVVMEELGRSSEPNRVVFWLLYGFALGVASLWMYAAMQPRFGSGAKTVLYAAGTVWFFTYFSGAMGLATGEFFLQGHRDFWLMTIVGPVWGLVELSLATALGAWLYQRGQEARYEEDDDGFVKISYPRMIMSGVVIGFVFPLLGGLVDLLLVSLFDVSVNDEKTGYRSLEAIEKLAVAELEGPALVTAFVYSYWIGFGIAFGIVVVSVYAAIRPRFGHGAKPGVYAGLFVGFVLYVLGGPFPSLTGLSAAIWGLWPLEGTLVLILTHAHLPVMMLAVVWICKGFKPRKSTE